MTPKQIDRKFSKGDVALVVVHTKYEPLKYIINNEETFYKFFLDLLDTNKEQGYYDVSDEEPECPDFDEESIDSLPKSLQGDARRILATYRENLKQYHESKVFLNDVSTAIRLNDGELAYTLVERRSNEDYQYERVTVEFFDILWEVNRRRWLKP